MKRARGEGAWALLSGSVVPVVLLVVGVVHGDFLLAGNLGRVDIGLDERSDCPVDVYFRHRALPLAHWLKPALCQSLGTDLVGLLQVDAQLLGAFLGKVEIPPQLQHVVDKLIAASDAFDQASDSRQVHLLLQVLELGRRDAEILD